MSPLLPDPSLRPVARGLPGRRWRRAGLLGIVAMAAGGTVSTDMRGQELRTNDGRVFVGAIQKDDVGYTVPTDAGDVRVPNAEVQSFRSRAELLAELRRLERSHGDSAFAQLELARFARDWQLDAAMWDHLDACLAANPEGATARRLGAFFESLGDRVIPEDLRITGDARHTARELLRRMRVGDPDARSLATEYALAGLQGEGVDETLREQARRAGSPQRRLTAVRALDLRSARAVDANAERTAPQPNDLFVLRTAILDSHADVRTGALATGAGARLGDDAVHYLAPGLGSSDPKVQVRTADALAGLQAPAVAMPYLVSAGLAAAAGPLPSGSTRGHVAFLNQQAYIRDFDVEVAQAAFIADPKIDVLQSGVVLDVTVHAVRTTRVTLVNAYRRALRSLAGTDPGADPSTWPYWLEAQRKLREKAAARPEPDADQPRGVPTTNPGISASATSASTCGNDVLWAGLPTRGAPVIGAPIGGPPATQWPSTQLPSTPWPSTQLPSTTQAAPGIQPASIGVVCPGQPAIGGGAAW